MTMKIIYKTIPISELPKLNDYWQDGWILTGLQIKDTIFLYRELKKSRTERKAEETPQFRQFKILYPKKTSFPNEKIMKKISESIKDGTFPRIIEWLERYNKHILIQKISQKYTMWVERFLNEKRWEDVFEDFDIAPSDRWKLDLMKDLNELQTKAVLQKIKDHESTIKRDCNEWEVKNIIEFILNK